MKKEHAQAGFTLIEMAIGLVIIGLLVPPVLALYKIQIKSKTLSFNLSQFTTVKENINYYVTHQGRYPIPASLLSAQNDIDYGTEAAGPIADCTTWPTANGICTTGGANPILIGAVPFQEIGVNQEFINDYWHNKILYAVTASQTTAYTAGTGAIITQAYDSTRAIITIENDVDMMLLSHGENGRGGYTQNGALISSCAAGTPAIEQENCDMDGTFMLRANKTVFPSVGTASFSNNIDYYDDLTDEQRSVPVDLWLQNLTDSDVALTFATRIGIGTEDPQAKIHVVGDVRADKLLSDNVCNPAMAACFNPIIIAGSVPVMDCSQNSLSGNQPVVSLGNSQVYCASPVNSVGSPIDGTAFEFPVGFGRIDCSTVGKLMAGIDGSGDPICVTP